MEKIYLSLSTHQFVDFLFRTGDIDDRIYNAASMQMGSKLHSAYQKKQGASYQSEVPLSGQVEIEEGTIFFQGRADGIIVGGEITIIDELKTCLIPVEEFYKQQQKWHFAQALVYAYLYLLQHEEEAIEIQLTYISQLDFDDRLVKKKRYSRQEVITEIQEYARLYLSYCQQQQEHISKRDESLANARFPFAKYRKGQALLAKNAYNTIQEGSILFAEAPTGIGKTLSMLYPAIKSFKQHRVDRIFYFTAKQTGSIASSEAMKKLYEHGFVGRHSVVISKEKICRCKGSRCNPSSCPYAEGYYTKVKEVIKEICSKHNIFDEESVLEYADKYTICPFELQLDLSLYSDVIICDYNYLLDPMVYLERYFEEGVDMSTDVFFFDEAHNLVDRIKDMHSSTISIDAVHAAHKALKGANWKKTRKALRAFETYLSAIPFCYKAEVFPLIKEEFLAYIDAFKKARNAEEGLEEASPEALSTLSRDLAKFRLLLEDYYGDNYTSYTIQKSKESIIKLHCLDASNFVKERIRRGKASIFFSATLSPMSYYQQTILGEKDYPTAFIPSPFSKSQMRCFVYPNISVKYKDREASLETVARILSSYCSYQKGNYLLFFPSYEYLNNILPLLDIQEANILAQSRSMSMKERQEMLESFLPNPSVTTVGCAILGGAFSEGVDLTSDRLIGVGIVGVGMPQINFESDLVRDYYEEKEQKGFAYAYLYPGLNKVAQALGRLIRTEEDRGTALLIDTRYRYGEYRAMLDGLTAEYTYLYEEDDLLPALTAFFHSH